eukprot:scaffold47451_cov140-Isochrysis_galbana.AAC.3
MSAQAGDENQPTQVRMALTLAESLSACSSVMFIIPRSTLSIATRPAALLLRCCYVRLLLRRALSPGAGVCSDLPRKIVRKLRGFDVPVSCRRVCRLSRRSPCAGSPPSTVHRVTHIQYTHTHTT